MKFVLEYKVDPILESVAHGKVVSGIFTSSGRCPLFKLRHQLITGRKSLSLCFMRLCTLCGRSFISCVRNAF